MFYVTSDNVLTKVERNALIKKPDIIFQDNSQSYYFSLPRNEIMSLHNEQQSLVLRTPDFKARRCMQGVKT